MPNYSVRWTIDIFDADGPEHAAVKALIMHRDPDSIATYFEVSRAGDPEVLGLNADTSAKEFRKAVDAIERRTAARYMYREITGRDMPHTVTVDEVITELEHHIGQDNDTFRKPELQPTSITYVDFADLLPNQDERRKAVWYDRYKGEAELCLQPLSSLVSAEELTALQKMFDGLTGRTWVNVEWFPKE